MTAASAVLPSEDRGAYETHRRGFFDEYQPATPTETQLTQELADTSWRLNRIPLLEADLLSRADTVDAYRALATLGTRSQRLSRQFQKSPRRRRPPRTPQTQRSSLGALRSWLRFFKMRLNESRHIEHVLFHQPPTTSHQPPTTRSR